MFTVGELAAALGMPMSDLVAGGMWDMGPVVAGELSATYAWDAHHEEPVASADALAGVAIPAAAVRQLGAGDVVHRIVATRPAGDPRST